MYNITLNLTIKSNQTYYKSNQITIDLDTYINGCVAKEIGNAPLEACKAQAIAARTNAYQYILKNKVASDSSSVFQAFSAERINNSKYENARLAAEITSNMVLAYNGIPLTPASFSANNGGQTTSSKERWGTEKPWLISQKDPYDVGDKTGHGVGMSQRGAAVMAQQGFSYLEILNFYYPNTTIIKLPEKEDDNMDKETAVKNFAEENIGAGYVWGSGGQVLTESLLSTLYEKYPTHINKSIVKKWIGKKVYDCASFVRLAMKQAGISMVSGATSQWNKTSWAEKGTIDTLPVNKVCCLYRATSDTNMQHTGIYMGDGTFIDDRGSSSGVVHNKIGTYAWTHWGIPKGLYDENDTEEVLKVAYQATVSTSGGVLNLRKSASSSASKIDSIPNGTVIDVISASNGWSQVIYNGQSGYVMSSYLKTNDSSSSDTQKYWYVRVKCDNESDAKSIVAAIGKLSKAEAIQI